MKTFLAQLNLARVIILLSIVGSAYLGWASYQKHQEVSFLRGTFAVQVPKLAREIQELSLLNSKLEKDIKGDQFISTDSPESYVRRCADNPSVAIGDVVADPTSRQGPNGTTDNKITIRPSDSKKAFTHSQIAAFLYRLEADSNQIKVTNLSYRLLGKGVKPDEIPEDEWTFEATITNRIKDPSKSAPNAGS